MSSTRHNARKAAVQALYQWDITKQDAQDIEKHFFSALDPVEKAILRLGAYELSYKADVPTRVVINEMIELAKVFGSDHSYKFVNGVIDKLAKELRKAS